MTTKKHEYFAATLVTIAFLLGSIQYAMVKAVSQQVPAFMVVFFLYFFGLLCYSPSLIRSKFTILKTKRPLLLIFRALAGLALWFGLFYAVKHIPLVDATLLVNLAPVWVPIIAWIALRHSIKKSLYLGIIIGFIGCAFILKPDNQVFAWAALLAILAGFFMAITLVAVKELMHTEKSGTIVIYYFLVNTLCLLPFAIKYWTIPNLFVLALLIGNAILMVFHMELLNRGFHLDSAPKLSVLTYTGILFSAILGWMFWQEIPDIWTIIGGILICVGGIYVLRYPHLKSTF